jgi:type II secretion system protein G
VIEKNKVSSEQHSRADFIQPILEESPMFSQKSSVKCIFCGFTLIELLIVVAIIAILAAIAVPNFMEAQTRAKISRTHADMRSMATALESYNVDNATYPTADSSNWTPLSARCRALSTPVAYIASIPRDIFPDLKSSAFENPEVNVDTFDYYSKASDGPGAADNPTLFGRLWRMASAGPDMHQGWGGENGVATPYDATNGTKSNGDIWLVQGGGNAWPYTPR